jgi:hypothetical protein
LDLNFRRFVLDKVKKNNKKISHLTGFSILNIVLKQKTHNFLGSRFNAKNQSSPELPQFNKSPTVKTIDDYFKDSLITVLIEPDITSDFFTKSYNLILQTTWYSSSANLENCP